jgi:hypothetical protein
MSAPSAKPVRVTILAITVRAGELMSDAG